MHASIPHTKQGKEVEYAVRAFPLGGYVAFPDDEEDSKFAKDDPNLLRNRPPKDRAIVISAGVIANVRIYIISL
jgi:membrane-associated protease RseP (regulator of RpoE activity)